VGAEANQRARIKIIQESDRRQATSEGPLPLVGSRVSASYSYGCFLFMVWTYNGVQPRRTPWTTD
jgi:hypothetical protein